MDWAAACRNMFVFRYVLVIIIFGTVFLFGLD